MWTLIGEVVLLILYLPVTLLFLSCGFLLEETTVATAAQWFEYRFCGYLGPVLGLLTWPCLFAAIWLRKRGKTKAAAWLRIAPLMAFAVMFLMCYVLRWTLG